MSTIQIIQVTPEQLKKHIQESIKNELENFSKHFKPEPPKEFLNRQQVADMLGVHITTISNWQKNGTLNPLGLSGKVFFLRSEVEMSLKPLNV